MKRVIQFIIVLVIIMVVLFVAINLFVMTRGKALAAQQLQTVLGRDVSMGSLYIVPPYSCRIRNMEIKDFATVNAITVEPSIIGFLAGKIALNTLILDGPKLSVVRETETTFNVNRIVDAIQAWQRKQTGPSKQVIIKTLVLRDGTVTFDDTFEHVSFTVAPIDVSVNTSVIDFKTRVNADAKAAAADGKQIATLSANGWLNVFKKDMDVAILFDSIDVPFLSAYAPELPRKIQSGTLLLKADMVSKNNNLTVDCHLETKNLRFLEEPEPEEPATDMMTLFGSLSGIMVDTLIGPGGGGVFDFSIHTKFDRPRLEGLQFKGSLFKEPIKNILNMPQEQRKETIEKIEGNVKAIGEEFEKQFKDLKDQFERLGEGQAAGESLNQSQSQSFEDLGEQFMEQFKDIGDLFKKSE